MREQYLPQPTDQAWTATPPGCNTGDAITAGAGGRGALHLMAHSWGRRPCCTQGGEVPRAVRRTLAARLPGGQFARRALRQRILPPTRVPAGDVCGPRTQRRRHSGLDRLRRRVPPQVPDRPRCPGRGGSDERLRKSWLGAVYWKDWSLDGLAAQIGVDAAGLAASVARMNEFARTGVDASSGAAATVRPLLR